MTLKCLPLLAMAACTPMPGAETPSQTPASQRYGAVGTEPFWSLGLARGRMGFADAEGHQIDVAAPPARSTPNGLRYVTDRLTLDITHQPCSDGMSDKTYPDTVRVTADGRELKGCGEAKADNAIEGRDWRVGAIGGEAPGGPRPATLRFADGRVSGTTGCNRVMGSYRLEGDRLTLDGIGTTRMACPGAAMSQEAAIVAALRGPMTIVQGKDGVMLTGADGTSLTLIAVRP